MARVARVLVDSPLPQLDRLFDYLIPASLEDAAVPGVRVTVPLRSAGRLAAGLLVEIGESASFAGPLAALESVVSPARVLQSEVWTLARRVADRQAGSANDVLRLAIPPRAVRVEKAWLAAHPHPAAPRSPESTSPAPGRVDSGDLEGYSAGLATAIDGGERVALRAIPRLVEVAPGQWVGHWAVTLAQAAVRVRDAGKSAILAVADYRDQEQLVAALTALGAGDSLAALDARQPNPARYQAFLSCLGETPRIVVGPRSAVYAPAARLGLIALFDDGDPLFTEPLAPYAHARDVALMRQEQQGGALVLAAHTRSVEAQRLVELGWLQDVSPSPAVTPKVVPTGLQHGERPTRIPSSAWKLAREALATGPVLVQVARPGDDPEGQGSQRTAADLGRAFPKVRIVVSDGERPLTHVGAEPALVVATRAAEPIAAGGYAAVLLLDGQRTLHKESLHVGDDCLRWWSNAAAFAAPGAPVVLVEVAGALAQSLVLWRQDTWAAAQLADRRQLGFPPAVRLATITGRPDQVRAAVAAAKEAPIRDVLGPEPHAATHPGGEAVERAIVRFDYAHGAEVATALRGAVVRSAQAGRRPAGRTRPAPTLRVKFDDPDAL
ncbi:primosomal protein N' [Gryllotalpicola sp.]|uniref:primosomal protein N' family DNA-binding protein n=1 Tax=Gryllotalpicola sp. TaxID=1932787 RepID=UPI0026328C1E|nr:primosomal protein N' [Gryllotalpicola sp.]